MKLVLCFLSLQPDVYPGNCWAFKGSQGYLVIRLSLRIRPVSFCLEHIPKALSPTGNITSAPRNFTVHVRNTRVKKKKLKQRLLFFPSLADVVILSCSCYAQGLDDEYQEEGKLLGHYTYQEDGESLQSFPVTVTDEAFLSRYMWNWSDAVL